MSSFSSELSTSLCLHYCYRYVSLLFEIDGIEIKIEEESRLHCIDVSKYDNLEK